MALEEPSDWLKHARSDLREGRVEQAMETVRQRLLIQSDDGSALMLAAEIEASRDLPAEAIDLAQSVPRDSVHWQTALEFVYQQSFKADDSDSTEWALRKLARSADEASLWQQRYWDFLNVRGRRREASVIAHYLCRTGNISPPVLQSLVRRGASFPFTRLDSADFDPQQHFVSDLAMARWWFANGEHELALKSISGVPPSQKNLRGQASLMIPNHPSEPL